MLELIGFGGFLYGMGLLTGCLFGLAIGNKRLVRERIKARLRG